MEGPGRAGSAVSVEILGSPGSVVGCRAHPGLGWGQRRREQGAKGEDQIRVHGPGMRGRGRSGLGRCGLKAGAEAGSRGEVGLGQCRTWGKSQRLRVTKALSMRAPCSSSSLASGDRGPVPEGRPQPFWPQLGWEGSGPYLLCLGAQGVVGDAAHLPVLHTGELGPLWGPGERGAVGSRGSRRRGVSFWMYPEKQPPASSATSTADLLLA